MSRISDLIAQAKAKEPALGADLEREFKALSSRLPFGLNFERHSPEAVELPQRPIRKGDKVRLLPPRGSTKKGDQQLWQVRTLDRQKRTAELAPIDGISKKPRMASLDDLVVVAEFRDTIYPGLISTGKVERSSGTPYHTVINGENYHVLKALTYTHRGKVDVIYIDPPYNTGARDWKYNNDYVESDDLYRHSKWLAMLERRLKLARELLNPADSVLIVTIDEKEYLRLGLLLEQTFPEANIQMVSSIINPKGQSRKDAFARTDEYIFIAMLGAAHPKPCALSNEWRPSEGTTTQDIRWQSLRRAGLRGAVKRTDRPNLFYPIYVKTDGTGIHSVGEPIPLGKAPSDDAPKGTKAVWPKRSDGTDGYWQVSHERVKELNELGFVRAPAAKSSAILYLKSGEAARVSAGHYRITGRRPDGSVETAAPDGLQTYVPGTQWRITSHNAGVYGTSINNALIPNRFFPFPKSLYAVEDTLRFFVSHKPDAVLLDFFAGSGTTAHAVMRLNRLDQGSRQCILVTNNEVAADEQKSLRERGLRPGDPEWESLGICDFITKPRVKAAITGMTPEGETIRGEYKFTDPFPMSEGFFENAEFFTLTYETPVSVSHNLAFARIAPLLWLRAGAQGKRIEKIPECGWAVVETYGIVFDIDKATPFIKAIKANGSAGLAYVVTDDDRRFQSVAKRLPEHVRPIRIYESYLTNFSFSNGD